MNRREFLTSTGVAAASWSTLLAPIRVLAADVKPIRIKDIENFTIQIPVSDADKSAGVAARYGITRVTTESGIRGYSVGGGGGGGGGRGQGGRGGAAASTDNPAAMRVGAPGGPPLPSTTVL
jgi:hypothetical protein